MNAPATTARPLAGRVILVTRAQEQAGRVGVLLVRGGGRVLVGPTIVIEPPSSWAPLDEALARASAYQWAVFTSVNGVEMVRRRLDAAGHGRRALASCRVAAIGPATARALRAWGLAPEVVPDEYVAEGLAARLRALVKPGDRVLLPRAAETRELLVRELEAMGAVVDEVAAYRTRPAAERAPGLRDALGGGEVDVATFTSPSTVRNFAALVGRDELVPLMSRVVVACIGPITRATADALGLGTRIMPAEYTIPGLARAIAAYFEEQRS
jgi:uroporphyrinogen III methyltransferase/synthase